MNRKTSETKSYHHGDLRSALIAAAERLMDEQANWTFTLREVARVAGVSHNAPYNHFADRRALLAAIAARGFDDLNAALHTSTTKAAREGPLARIRIMARTYVAFAIRNTSRYRLMFSAELTGCEDTEFQRAANQAFDMLQSLIEDGIAKGVLRADIEGKYALAAWSLIHGFSTLVLDGRIPKPKSDRALTDLTNGVAETLINGMIVSEHH